MTRAATSTSTAPWRTEKVDTQGAEMVGDSTWDAVAARPAGIDSIGILTGGFSEKELGEGGWRTVHRSVTKLLDHLDDLPLA